MLARAPSSAADVGMGPLTRTHGKPTVVAVVLVITGQLRKTAWNETSGTDHNWSDGGSQKEEKQPEWHKTFKGGRDSGADDGDYNEPAFWNPVRLPE